MQIAKPTRKTAAAKKKPAGDPGSKKPAANSDTVRLNVNMPREMYRQLRIKAAEKETSVSRAVIGLIENYVTRQ